MLRVTIQKRLIEGEILGGDAPNYATNKIDIRSVNAKENLAWKDGLLKYKSVPLCTLLNELEKRYEVPIHIDNKMLLDSSVTRSLPIKNIKVSVPGTEKTNAEGSYPTLYRMPIQRYIRCLYSVVQDVYTTLYTRWG